MGRRPQQVLLVEAVAMLDAEAPRVQAAQVRERGQGAPAEPPELGRVPVAFRVGGRGAREADRRERDGTLVTPRYALRLSSVYSTDAARYGARDTLLVLSS